MKLLKIVLIFFAVYFIRRFIQLYKAMKRIQDERQATYSQQAHTPKNNSKGPVIEADFKVVD